MGVGTREAFFRGRLLKVSEIAAESLVREVLEQLPQLVARHG